MQLSEAICALVNATEGRRMTRKELARLLKRPVTKICQQLVRSHRLSPVLIDVVTKRGKRKQRIGYAAKDCVVVGKKEIIAHAVAQLDEGGTNVAHNKHR